MNSRSDYEVDTFIASTFVLVPAIINFGINIGLAALEINPLFGLIGYVLYFIIPFAFLIIALDFKLRPAFNFSIVVPLIVVLTEIPFALILNLGNT